ncbi:MAG: hypothetical protein LBI33_14045 [Propionibacteriaceae bacterium]|jgi:hypothetical protein|nr:hypothetical protein [Propionibacteriaceae bacterium]
MVTPADATTANEYVVVGFTGGYRGDEETLAFHRPVVRQGDQTYAAVVDNWTPERGLVLLDEHDQFARLPDRHGTDGSPSEPSHSVIRPGQGVWLAGKMFRSRCKELPPWDDRISFWERVEGQFRYRVGTRQAFREFTSSLFRDAVVELYERLCSPHDVVGRGKPVFEILNNLHEVDAKAQAVQRGIWYAEVSDLRQFDMVVADAIRDGLFETSQMLIGEVGLACEDVMATRARRSAPLRWHDATPRPVPTIEELTRAVADTPYHILTIKLDVDPTVWAQVFRSGELGSG